MANPVGHARDARLADGKSAAHTHQSVSRLGANEFVSASLLDRERPADCLTASRFDLHRLRDALIDRKVMRHLADILQGQLQWLARANLDGWSTELHRVIDAHRELRARGYRRLRGGGTAARRSEQQSTEDQR
jgi:hypothetical protein